jgi:hypothetical protein
MLFNVFASLRVTRGENKFEGFRYFILHISRALTTHTDMLSRANYHATLFLKKNNKNTGIRLSDNS